MVVWSTRYEGRGDGGPDASEVHHEAELRGLLAVRREGVEHRGHDHAQLHSTGWYRYCRKSRTW